MSSLKNNSLTFKNQNFYIGIDVHKKQWTISVISMNMLLKTYVSIDPTPDTLLKFIQRRYPDGNYYAVYEAGFSGFWAARELNRIGIHCIVTHPADVPTKQKERLNKNDRVDSKKLARSLSNGDLEAIYIPDRIAEEYRSLNRYRFQTIKDQTRLKNRIKSKLHYYGITIPNQFEDRRWSGKFINWLLSIKFNTKFAQFSFNDLVKQLVETRKRLTEILKTMRIMAKEVISFSLIVPFFLTVPGIGFITAMTLLTEIIDMNRFKTLESLAAFVGLIPSIQSSDEKEKNLGISDRRNKYLRTILVEAAWIAVKKDPALTMKFAKLSQRMNNNKAIVRIAKMLLSRIRYVWKNQKPYVNAVVA
jgi:transposase